MLIVSHVLFVNVDVRLTSFGCNFFVSERLGDRTEYLYPELIYYTLIRL